MSGRRARGKTLTVARARERDRRHARADRRCGAAVPAVLSGHRLRRHDATRRERRRTRGSSQTITVRFNADVDPDLPWSFRPSSGRSRSRIGEQSLAYYRARQSVATIRSSARRPTTSRRSRPGPTSARSPASASSEQVLQPGEEVDMPVSFYVDPGDPERSEHAGRAHDHLVVHLLPDRGRDRGARDGAGSAAGFVRRAETLQET